VVPGELNSTTDILFTGATRDDGGMGVDSMIPDSSSLAIGRIVRKYYVTVH
jgi:hypothetical protein